MTNDNEKQEKKKIKFGALVKVFDMKHVAFIDGM
jgi:hypothetical protein